MNCCKILQTYVQIYVFLLKFEHMITVPEVVEELVRKSPFIDEALSDGMINTSALARRLKPQIEDILLKTVTEGSIVMALKRLAQTRVNTKNEFNAVFQQVPDMIVRSNLVEVTVPHTIESRQAIQRILQTIGEKKNALFIVTQGVFETTMIISTDLLSLVNEQVGKERVAYFDNISSITIALPESTVPASGIYYQILKSLALEKISIVEVASTYTEFTIMLRNDDVERAFSTLKRLFQNR